MDVADSRGSGYHRAILMAWLILGVLIAPCRESSALAAAERTALPTEYQMKAALLFNIARFLEWPEGSFRTPSAPMIIGVLGEDPFGIALDAARDRPVGGRKVQIRRFTRLDEVTECNILFIARSEKGKLPAVLRSLGKSSTLLVGDGDEFTKQGGMIDLVLEKEAVVIEINVEALTRTGIKANSRLLKVARIVRTNKF